MGFGQASFDRLAILKVTGTQVIAGTPVTGPQLQPISLETAFRSKQDDGSPGFRIKFTINKVVELSPNPSSIYIYNLGPDSRAKFEKQNNLVVLEAGYGNNSEIIFKGNIMRSRTRKEGPDYVTQVEAADGLFAAQNARIDTSFKSAISANAVINTLVGALSGSGVKPGQTVGVPTNVYNSGIVLSGRVMDQLKQVCDQNDLAVSIQDGELLIVPVKGAKLTPVITITSGDDTLGIPNTGLVGIPEKRENGGISFRTLMNTKIGVFQKVLIISKFVKGLYTTSRVVHTGDTFGNEWYTDCEAI